MKPNNVASPKIIGHSEEPWGLWLAKEPETQANHDGAEIGSGAADGPIAPRVAQKGGRAMRRVARAVTIADLERIALRRLPKFASIVLTHGAGRGVGIERNVHGFSRILLQPRALVERAGTEQSSTLFGQTYSSPFGLSALGSANIYRHRADELLAEAAVEANIPFILSGASGAPIETIARIAPHHIWQQLYAARDPKFTERLLGRARDAGVSILVYTVDLPIPPKSEWLERAGIRFPASIMPRAWPYVAWQAATHPRWTLDCLRQGGVPRLGGWAAFAPPDARAGAIADVFRSQIPSIPTWNQLEHIRRHWPGKLVIKGVLNADDAQRAVQLGVDAVSVSNHGANHVDFTAAPIDILPTIAANLAGSVPVLFDSGIRRGADILIALGLGAQFCFIGRAALFGVAAGGLAGVRKAITILREDIDRTQAYLGCPRASDMGAFMCPIQSQPA